jgi:peptidyl-prolyl cis-trans isomerase C
MKMNIKVSVLVASLSLMATAGVAADLSGAAKAPTERSGVLLPEVLVNGVPISHEQVQLFMQTLLANDGDQEKGDLESRHKAAIRELASQEAMAQLATSEGLEQDPEVEDVIARARREILSRVYIQHYFATNPVTDVMLKAGYEYNRSNGKIMEYKVRQILLSTREAAAKVMERMKKGEDFMSLTKLSRDPGGNTNGGYLSRDGWFRTDIFVDPYFTDEVEEMAKKKGHVSSKPFRTRFGWHIIRVDEVRPLANPEPFEKLKPEVLEAMRQKLAQRKLNELITSIIDEAKVTDASGKVVSLETLEKKPK